MIYTRKLSNGIRIVMESMPSMKSMSIGVWVGTGAVDEDVKYAGISHFVEHMMFKGTENRTAKDIAYDIDKIGGQINAFTGKEATCYYVKTLSDNYKKAADVLVDMMENSLFSKTELDRERMVICEEIKMSKDAPDDVAHDTLCEVIFKNSNLGNNILGTPSSLKRITHNIMKDYVKSRYTRDNIVISVAGSFDEDDVCDYFNNKFLKLNKNHEISKNPENIIVDDAPKAKVVVKDIMQSHLCIGVESMSMKDERLYAFRILNNIMGGSMSSRLFQNIRETKGLAYSVYSSIGAFSKSGYFEIYAGISHDKLRETIEGLRNELKILEKQSISEEEFNSSKEQMKAAHVFNEESTAARMVLNGKNFLLLKTVYESEEILNNFEKVTINDIDEVKKIICDFDKYSGVLVTGKKQNLKSIMGK